MMLRCSLCREKFSWNPSGGWPSYCPKCGEYIGTDGKDEVVIPFISQAKNLGGDRVYRQMERDSEARAQMAAEMTGLSSADVSHLKITNMRDNQRTGDIAAIEINNAVTQAMQAAAPGTVGMGSPLGAQLSAGTRIGPLPRAGAEFMKGLTMEHHRAHRAEVLAGSIINSNGRKK